VTVDEAGALDGAALDGLDVVVADLGRRATLPPLDRVTATQRALAVIESGRVRGVLRLQDRAPPDDVDGVDLDVRAVLSACARRRVFVEVRSAELSTHACRTATEVGALLAITGRPGVDDGELNDDVLARQRRLALWQARRGWCTPAQTLNALDERAVRAFLRVADRSDDVPADDAESDDGDDPLFQPARREELMARLASFLRGEGDDPALRRALERRGGNALAEAFALLAAGGRG
jgi:hypothetical protein